MNGVIARMETYVRERIATAWPALAEVRVEARPLLDLSLGDFGIDCCLAIGATLKRRPEDVAREFVGAVPEHPEFLFVALDGFINVTVRNPGPILAEDCLALGVGSEMHRVIIQPPTLNVSRDCFVRLLGSAVVQAALLRSLGGASELYVGAERCEGGSVDELFRAGLRHGVVVEGAAARRAIEAHLGDGVIGVRTVWIAPNFLERGDFREFYRCYFAAQPRCILRCPTRGWSEGFQESWWDIAQRHHRSGAVALMVASGRAPDELDEYSLDLSEQGNLGWFIESTHRRLERLASGATSEAAPSSGPLSPTVRRVALRTATIGLFERGAALRGEVTEWIDALTDLLRSVNLWMNAPETRRALEGGGMFPIEREILSGAHKAVSDIMRTNPLFYEVERT